MGPFTDILIITIILYVKYYIFLLIQVILCYKRNRDTKAFLTNQPVFQMGTPSSSCIDYQQFKSTIVNPLFVDRPRLVPGGTPHGGHTLGPQGLCPCPC